MPNPQLDQFMHAMMWKVVPVVILCTLGGLLLRELLQWFERSATRAMRGRRKQRESTATKNPQPLDFELEDAPHCPTCNTAMVKRTARRGANAGQEFWGCSSYPKCRGTRAI